MRQLSGGNSFFMIDREHRQLEARTAAPVLNPLLGSPSVHLDALRGFAAFSVLISHWRMAFFVDNPLRFRQAPLRGAAYLVSGLGHQWVIVFFVMSGYLVGGSVLRSVDSGRWSWRGYLLSRLTRLYLVLVPALILGGALDWAGMHFRGTEANYNGGDRTGSLCWNVRSSLSLKVLVANGLFLQTISLPGMHGERVPVFGSNGPLWSLSNEFWYYLAFPLLVLLWKKAQTWWTRASYMLGLVGLGWFVGADIAELGIPWLMGALIVYAPPFPARGPRIRGLAIVAALALFGGGLVLGFRGGVALAPDLVLGLIVTLLIWVTQCCATAPLPSGYVKVARRSARSSYTLYLTHFPCVIFLKASLHLPRAVPSWHVLPVSAGLLVVILLYSQLVYELFEKHTDRVRNWIKPSVMQRQTA
jgi:peptidoglycan/LPS O-acetylase OafA/YrhL